MWKKKLYIKNNEEPYPINRTKFDLYNDCRRCFYLDIVKGIRRPHGPPQVINTTIIQLIKSEFNFHRENNTQPKALKDLDEGLTPINHEKLELWRNPFIGIQYIHRKSNFKISGSINDLWFCNKEKKFVVVDYKSTSKKDELTDESIWPGYWNQLSYYKYLLEKNGVEVSDKGYLFFLNAKKNNKDFNGNLSFKTTIFKKKLELNWIEETIEKIYKIAQHDMPPPLSNNCKYCKYVNIVNLFQ